MRVFNAVRTHPAENVERKVHCMLLRNTRRKKAVDQMGITHDRSLSWAQVDHIISLLRVNRNKCQSGT